MPKSKKPRAKSAVKKPPQKPAWYQAHNGPGGQHAERPTKAGKKSQNKFA